MYLKMLRAKIHRATVTQADLEYVGSITIDKDLLDASGILPGEQVCIANLDNGQRFETYVFEGQAGSGTICLNGACARCACVGDKIIIMSYAYAEPQEAKSLTAKVLLMDSENKITKILD